jgi:EAL and modified HD-GYP domain-containing signal transduction protein
MAMKTTDSLGRIVLQHSALIDRDHNLLAVRLGWSPLASCDEADAPNLSSLLLAMGDGLRYGTAALMLPARHTGDLLTLRTHGWWPGAWIEYPAGLAALPQAVDALTSLRASGVRMLARGRPTRNQSFTAGPELCIDSTGMLRVHDCVDTLEKLDLAVADGAEATLGWPVLGACCLGGSSQQEASLQLLIDIIQRIDQEYDIDRLGALIEASPTLAFRLLALLNSAAGGLRTEVTSVPHAIMLLGYRKLKQWLSLLLTVAVETPRTRPLTQASLRRAFLMQEVAQCLGSRDDRGDMFVCGMFSLLDRMLGQPMVELVRDVHLSEEITQCLAHACGPLKPYLDLARQVESGQPFDLDAACEATATTPLEVNGAVLRALAKAANVGVAAAG